MHALLHTRSHTFPCTILTPSYLLIGKADRRGEGWVKTHLVINSRSKTKTHFTDQGPLTLLPVYCACAPSCHCCASQSVFLSIAPKTFISDACSSTEAKKKKKRRGVGWGAAFHLPELTLTYLFSCWLDAHRLPVWRLNNLQPKTACTHTDTVNIEILLTWYMNYTHNLYYKSVVEKNITSLKWCFRCCDRV